jgi:hypothetical protein
LLSYNFSIGYDISLAGTRPAEFRLQFRLLPTGMIGRSLVRVQIVERNRQAIVLYHPAVETTQLARFMHPAGVRDNADFVFNTIL